MPETEFSIKVTGPGVSIDQKVAKDVATRILMLVLGDGKDVTPPGEDDGNKKSPPLSEATSLREYLDQHETSKIPHEIVGIGAYHQAKNNRNFFTKVELTKGFEDAGSQTPANLPRDIKNAISLGWISPKSGAKDQYYVTNTGTAALDAHFKKNVGGGRGRKPRKRSKPRVTKTTK